MLKKVNHIVINLCHVTVGITGIQWRQWRDGQARVDINMSRLLQVLHVTPPDCYRMPEIEGHIYDVECVKEVDRVMTWELSETICIYYGTYYYRRGHINATTRLYESCS